MSEFLIYPSQGCETAPRVAEYLGIESGRDMPSERYDYLIRWGSRRRVDYIPREFTLNKRRALVKSTNKLESLETMKRASVPVPKFSLRWQDLKFPLLERNTSHMEGRDIKLALQPSDITGGADFYTQYVPKAAEYRVHVFKGEILKISQKKRRDTEPDYDPVCWNYGTGWRFCHPDTQPLGLQQSIPAVTAHELDFGAVDVMIDPDGRPYILEVNSAPGCCETTLELYCEKIAETIGLEDYPGMDAVNWPEEEEENESE